MQDHNDFPFAITTMPSSRPMEPDHVKAFKAMMEARVLDQSLLTIIIKETIAINKALLWQDALAQYDLL